MNLPKKSATKRLTHWIDSRVVDLVLAKALKKITDAIGINKEERDSGTQKAFAYGTRKR